MAGSNTAEGTHTYTKSSTVTIHVSGDKAQPLTASVDLPNTTWHPKNDTDPVLFTEKSMKITSTLNILDIPGGVGAVFDCHPDPSLQIGGLSAQSEEQPTTTTVAPSTTFPTTVTTAGVTPTTVTAGNAQQSGSLPRTGASWVLLLVLGGAAIDVGIALIGATRRRLRS
jgi:hypothetical protein